MKKNFILSGICLLVLLNLSFSQGGFPAGKQNNTTTSSSVASYQGRNLPDYIELQEGEQIEFTGWQSWLAEHFNISPAMGFNLLNVQNYPADEFHYRYVQTYNGIPIDANVIIVHTRNNKVYSFNGNVISSLDISSVPAISEEKALKCVLDSIKASVYMWQMASKDEASLKEMNEDEKAIYSYPKGELTYIRDDENSGLQKYRLAYKFNIHALQPFSGQEVFVDALTNKIIFTENLIQNIDATGTAITMYSGTKAITTDYTDAAYRLREAGRGNGIETYNMQMGTEYKKTDFIDSDNIWNNVNPEMDEAATDAHWGAEMVYDYYYTKFNRNSLDDKGFKLESYVHADIHTMYPPLTNANAFWYAGRVVYGDGDGHNLTPYTCLDVAGHEFNHGLTEKTAQLKAINKECGALQEGFGDIFGTCIEWYARPERANWTIGEDKGSIVRDLQYPKDNKYPDAYKGIYWDPLQETHRNSTILSYWFYLLCEGGDGYVDDMITNPAYSVTGIGMEDAAKIAYKTLVCYLSSMSDYKDAYRYSILSAKEFFGENSAQVKSVKDAWFAVGISDTCSNIYPESFYECGEQHLQIYKEQYGIPFTNHSGYISGSNRHWDMEVAQKYKAPAESIDVTGVAVLYAKCTVSPGYPDEDNETFVRFYTVNGNGNPSTFWISDTINKKDIDTTDKGLNYNNVYHFSEPISISTDFYVGVVLPKKGKQWHDVTDELAIWTLDKECSQNSDPYGAYVRGSDYIWSSFTVDNGFNADLMILPIICSEDGSKSIYFNESKSYNIDNNIIVYPNPANNEFNIDFIGYKEKDVVVDVYNMIGKLVKTISSDNTADKLIIDMSDQTTGIYTVNIKTSSGIVTKKISLIK